MVSRVFATMCTTIQLIQKRGGDLGKCLQDTTSFGWELSVSDCRGHLVGTITDLASTEGVMSRSSCRNAHCRHPPCNYCSSVSLLVTDGGGNDIGLISGGASGIEVTSLWESGVVQDVAVYGMVGNDIIETPVATAHKGGQWLSLNPTAWEVRELSCAFCLISST